MSTFREFLGEDTQEYVNDMLDRALRKAGLGFTQKASAGFTKFTVKGPEKITLVNDGSGITVKQKNKEVQYYDRPKMTYKDAVKKVQDLMGVE